MTQIIYFPGQGSQKVGMGDGLFDAFPHEVACASEILGYDLAALCAGQPEGLLDQTQCTQPALYVVNALTYRQRQASGAAAPEVLAGHSLGEYNALEAAGVFDFETGLRLVQKRGALMAAASGGGMAAVIGMEAPRIAEILIENQLDRLDVANYNSPDQTVISGPSDLIADAQPIFEAAGVRAYIPLKVSAPFHSRYMQSAAEEFRAFLKGFTLRDPQIPVYANCTAEPYGPGEMIDLLPQQIASPVRWNETINKFLDLPAPEFTEVGPGRVLTGLLAKIRKARG